MQWGLGAGAMMFSVGAGSKSCGVFSGAGCKRCGLCRGAAWWSWVVAVRAGCRGWLCAGAVVLQLGLVSGDVVLV